MRTSTPAVFTAQEIEDAFSPVVPHPRAIGPVVELLQSGKLFRYGSAPGVSVTSELEVRFARLVGKRFAVAMNSCSSAIQISLEALRMSGVDISRVLIPAFTFIAVPGAVVHAGAKPVLIDVGTDLKIDVEDFRRKAKSSGARVFLLSHMRGHISDLDAIMPFCRENGIVVIEDAAHALGARWNGQQAGTFGAIGCYSFQDFKILAAGEGGMLVTDDEDIAILAILLSGAYEKSYRFHAGISDSLFQKYARRIQPHNFRYGELLAAVVLPQLDELDARVDAHRKLYANLVAKLRGRSNLFAFPPEDPRERRAPDSMQLSLTAGNAEVFSKHVQAAGFPLSRIGDIENARNPHNWLFLDKEAIADLDKTIEVLGPLCDMRLPLRLTEAKIDYTVNVFAEAAQRAACA
ncbi:aminotransferase class I/II-fold pyridoxal phosphate-dependent enzyme [Candidatus Kaiserbacteria bacterium]|nr:aminotransferase class I/II-fold pyridoxal phosphate-dependent enzyme [Candidatus Kaiserbacteria bacterium]